MNFDIEHGVWSDADGATTNVWYSQERRLRLNDTYRWRSTQLLGVRLTGVIRRPAAHLRRGAP
jgi:hypothetical protein